MGYKWQANIVQLTNHPKPSLYFPMLIQDAGGVISEKDFFVTDHLKVEQSYGLNITEPKRLIERLRKMTLKFEGLQLLLELWSDKRWLILFISEGIIGKSESNRPDLRAAKRHHDMLKTVKLNSPEQIVEDIFNIQKTV